MGGMFTKAPIATTNCPSLEVGVDIYYKYARDLLDDGQFGAAYVLTGFNYDKAENWGMEQQDEDLPLGRMHPLRGEAFALASSGRASKLLIEPRRQP